MENLILKQIDKSTFPEITLARYHNLPTEAPLNHHLLIQLISELIKRSWNLTGVELSKKSEIEGINFILKKNVSNRSLALVINISYPVVTILFDQMVDLMKKVELRSMGQLDGGFWLLYDIGEPVVIGKNNLRSLIKYYGW